MPEPVIAIENLSKAYRLGVIGTGTVRNDLKRWWARVRKRPDPLLRVDQTDQADRVGESIWALKDINLTVQKGDALGIIGRNGAGKSTLLKIISQVTAPTKGVIKAKGRIASLLEVGTGFHPELTGRENIFLNGAIMGMTRAETRSKLDEIVDFSGVERFIDTPVKRYSSGMYVRLAFAVAAHLEPDILVVDEVLAVGDAAFQRKCLGKMGDVTQHGRTVLFVSHTMPAIQSLCEGAHLLDGGKLVHSGKSEDVISKYLQGAAETAAQDLKVRTDRRGDGQLRITRLSLEDEEGAPIPELVSGKPCSVVLDYEAEGPLKNVVVSIVFNGNLGQFLLLCRNELSGHTFESLPPVGQMRCTFPRLPFAQGVYQIDIGCLVNGLMADMVKDGAAISVTEGDFYGTGKVPDLRHGTFLAPHSWSHS